MQLSSAVRVPMPIEANDKTVSNVVVSCVSALGNHLADPSHAARGGDLWMAFPNGSLSNLTRAAGFGLTSLTPSAVAQQGERYARSHA